MSGVARAIVTLCTVGALVLGGGIVPIRPASAALTVTVTTVDSTGTVGLSTSLSLNGAGNPVISYWDATNDDLMAVCGDATCSSGNTLTTVDSTGSAGRHTSLELDGAGNPVISYYDTTNGDLKVAVCGDATCSSGNTLTTVDSAGTVGWYLSLELDGAGNPVISYHDATNGDLKVAVCGDATCSSGNTLTTVDSTGSAGQHTSLELDGAGNPVISYRKSTDLKVAVCGDATCSSGNALTTIDSTNVGVDTSLELDGAGNPVISYYDTTNGDLKVAVCGDATCSSANTLTTVDSTGVVGQFSSINLDGSGNPVISYWDSTNGDLKLAICGDATCSSGNTLTTLDSTGSVGRYTSLELDGAGNPVISYHDYAPGRDLKLATAEFVDSVSVSGLGFAIAGNIDTGDFVVNHDSAGAVTSVVGSGTIGTARVTISTRRLFFFSPLLMGSIYVSDPATGTNASGLIFGSVSAPTPTSATGSAPLVFRSTPSWRFGKLRWSVDDLA